MIPYRRVFSPCPSAHQRHQHPRITTPAQQPCLSRARPEPQEESGGLRFSHTMHFLEGNQLFPPSTHSLLPFSAALIPTLPSNWLSCFGRGLSWDENSKRGEESLFASNLREYYKTGTEQRTKLKQRSSRFYL